MFEGGRGVVLGAWSVAVDAESVVDVVEDVEVESGGGGWPRGEKAIIMARDNSRNAAMAARLGMGGL